MAETVRPLDARGIVAPLLPSLPVAAIASQPAPAVLPLLSPILRQRVQFLSASSSEPWIRLLSYDPAKAAQLVDVARSARLEPHPVSGEIEVDWDAGAGEVELRFKRLDIETLQALLHLRHLRLVFRLVYCDGDAEGEGGGSGWRVGEVSVPDEPDAFATFGGHATAAEAERAFREHALVPTPAPTLPAAVTQPAQEEDSEEDDDYWARYDATPAARTPARTPATKRSPAPASMRPAANGSSAHSHQHGAASTAAAEDAYYAQYDSVQPAMDNHDPDEVMEGEEEETQHRNGGNIRDAPPLGFGQARHDSTSAIAPGDANSIDHERLANLVHPRPASVSSHSSSGGGGGGGGAGSAVLVSKLEESAGRREQSEFGVKQHVSRSIKSLYLLARSSGIDRDEFEQLVKTELDMLAMMEE